MTSRKKQTRTIFSYVVILLVGVVMLFPLVWMIFACFKTNNEIFGSLGLFPSSWSFDAFIRGWRTSGMYTYATYFKNTFMLVVPTVIFTLFSCTLVAYGFARFNFKVKGILFMILITTMMLPNSVIIIPRYALFNSLGWLDTYLTYWIPALFACYPFFIFMLVQFLRGIPRDLDESAYMDGCGTLRCLGQILIPLLKPALFSAALFQFLWTWNDFFNTNIYINSNSKFPMSLALRMSLDTTSSIQWNQVMAMGLVSVLPLIILFFAGQKYFVEGIATTGMKN